jgi:hypothetical protein
MRRNVDSRVGAKDFRIFEDGREQKVENVSIEPLPLFVSRDNYGYHDEWSLTPQGKWSSPDLGEVGLSPGNRIHFYLLAYTPPPSKEGSCHDVPVKVNRQKLAVFAHTSYCDNKQPASDPLRGTKFGEQLKRDFALSKAGKMELSVQAGSLYSSGQDARVVLALEISWKSRWRTWQNGTFSATIGILGLVS